MIKISTPTEKEIVIYHLDEISNALQVIKKKLEEEDVIVSREFIYYYYEHLHSLLYFFPKKEV